MSVGWNVATENGMLLCMLKVILKTLVSLGLILAGGCGSPNPNVGTYELDRELIRAEILGDSKEPNSMQKSFLVRLDNSSATLVLNADGTCKMTRVDGPNVVENDGKWRVEGSKLFLDGKDRASQEPVTTELSFVDGVATMVSEAGGGPTQVFRKVAKK
ncbi:MAG: hypothetical protein ACI89X_000658 [Planctomycetota bacterium]|jgi:hypothetical protein